MKIELKVRLTVDVDAPGVLTKGDFSDPKSPVYPQVIQEKVNALVAQAQNRVADALSTVGGDVEFKSATVHVDDEVAALNG